MGFIYKGIYGIENIGIVEKKMGTTIMGLYRVRSTEMCFSSRTLGLRGRGLLLNPEPYSSFHFLFHYPYRTPIYYYLYYYYYHYYYYYYCYYYYYYYYYYCYCRTPRVAGSGLLPGGG